MKYLNNDQIKATMIALPLSFFMFIPIFGKSFGTFLVSPLFYGLYTGFILLRSTPKVETTIWYLGRVIGRNIQLLTVILLIGAYYGEFPVPQYAVLGWISLVISLFIEIGFRLNPDKREKVFKRVEAENQESKKTIYETINAFLDKYELEIDPFEVKRRAFIRKFCIILAFIFLGIVAVYFSFPFWPKLVSLIFLISCLFSVPFLLYTITKKIAQVIEGKDSKILGKDFTNNFKQTIISSLFKERGISFDYFPERHLSLADFQESQLSIEYGCRMRGDDLVVGESNGIKFKLSEIHPEDYKSSSNGGYYRSIFDGLLIKIDLEKKIYGSKFGTPSYGFGKEITLDHPTFNSLFKVHGNDSAEVFYVLSSSVLDKLVDLQINLGNSKVDFSVVGDKAYFAIHSNRPFLEPPIFRSLWNPEVYFEYIKVINFIDDLTRSFAK